VTEENLHEKTHAKERTKTGSGKKRERRVSWGVGWSTGNEKFQTE